jgi:hypothetical protein
MPDTCEGSGRARGNAGANVWYSGERNAGKESKGLAAVVAIMDDGTGEGHAVVMPRRSEVGTGGGGC